MRELEVTFENSTVTAIRRRCHYREYQGPDAAGLLCHPYSSASTTPYLELVPQL